MTSLPASVEQYLKEAGFTQTELLLLKRLMEGDALGLRELASKTGKSTGVLDQAAKKLVNKGILQRETVNDVAKFSLASIDAIGEWVVADQKIKLDQQQRKHQDFEAFLQTLALDKGRPEMQYFDGPTGIKQAYLKLLEKGEQWRQYVPIAGKEDDDPLYPFRVQLFRQRHKQGISARVLCPDNAHGKRYHSRDMFEYRETRLITEGNFPVDFEKIIVGDTVACFNHAEQKACFIRYPEHADTERKMFEMLWGGLGKSLRPVQLEPKMVPFKTRIVSALREFFLSRRYFAIFLVSAVFTLGIVYGLYQHNLYLNTLRVRERVKAIAATAAPEFNAADIKQINNIEDAQKPVYKKIIEQLRSIRSRNPDVVYSYIMRPTSDPYFFEFVADADSIDLLSREDLNEDGLINDMIAPGQLWFDDDPDNSAIHMALEVPAADPDASEDIWGVWIAGHAPIKDAQGNTVAVIGIDVYASDVHKLTHTTFKPLFWSIVTFTLFIFVGFLAFNKSKMPIKANVSTF